MIDAAPVCFRDLGIHAGLALQLQRAPGGNVHIQRFVLLNVGLVELVIHPELPGGEWRVNHRHHVIFENFSGTEARDRDVLLAVIGVDRGFALNGRAQILYRVLSCLHHRAVLLQHAHVRNLDAFAGGVVTLLQLSPLLHAGFALHPDAGDSFFSSGAVRFKAIGRVHLLNDK